MTGDGSENKVKLFLLVYDRGEGRLVEQQEFDASQRAAVREARFTRELRERANPHMEVVVLEAECADDLRKTHLRYFMLGGREGAEQFAARLADPATREAMARIHEKYGRESASPRAAPVSAPAP